MFYFIIVSLNFFRNKVNIRSLTPIASSAKIIERHFNKNIAFTKDVRELAVIVREIGKNSSYAAKVSKFLDEILIGLETPTGEYSRKNIVKTVVQVGNKNGQAIHENPNEFSSDVVDDTLSSIQPPTANQNAQTSKFRYNLRKAAEKTKKAIKKAENPKSKYNLRYNRSK